MNSEHQVIYSSTQSKRIYVSQVNVNFLFNHNISHGKNIIIHRMRFFFVFLFLRMGWEYYYFFNKNIILQTFFVLAFAIYM
jgi:hypothetical protein